MIAINHKFRADSICPNMLIPNLAYFWNKKRARSLGIDDGVWIVKPNKPKINNFLHYRPLFVLTYGSMPTPKK
jgi:hypothetical protein